MSVRNYEEYRAEALEQLGATTEDIRNEASWRAKVLETLGAEYTDEDTRNFERYRLKVLENLSGGGGGSSDFPVPKCTLNITIDKPEDVDFIDTYLRVYDATEGRPVSISFESADIQSSLNAEGYIFDVNGRFRPTIWGVYDESTQTEATFSYSFTNLVNAVASYDMADPDAFLQVEDWTSPCSATLVITEN